MKPVVLYVDDDADNVTVFQAGCGDDFAVLTAKSGAEALEIMAKEPVAVLLTDQRMPGMTGAELAEIVREKYPDTVRYLITAYSDLEAAIHAINHGHIRRYLRKPWKVDELKAVLREGMDFFDMHRKVRDLESRIHDMERVYALGVVSAGIAHELRNPMTIVIGNLDLAGMHLERVLEDPADDQSMELLPRLTKLVECVKHAQEASHEMVEIMRGIELSSRRQEDSRSSSISEVVRLTTKMISGELRKRGCEIELDMEPVGEVRGSRTQLGQVMLNLLINALEAMADRYGQQNKVIVRVASEGDHVRVEVEDNGPGMDAEVRERIFDPFFTTKANGGTGLGLAISKKIIEGNGGSLIVHSARGEGTRFVLTMPRATD